MMSELVPFIDIAKALGSAFGPIVAVIIGLARYKEEKLKERRARAIDMHAKWVALADSQEILSQAFPHNKYNPCQAEVRKRVTIPLEEIKTAIQDVRVLTALNCIISHFETTSLSVVSGAADEDTMFELCCAAFFSYEEQFREYIEMRRGREHVSYAIYYSYLVKKWRKRLDDYKSPFMDINEALKPS